MLKFLFFSIAFYFLMRYISRLFLPSKKQKKPFSAFKGTSRRRQDNFDEIEEAEYEDLSNTDN